MNNGNVCLVQKHKASARREQKISQLQRKLNLNQVQKITVRHNTKKIQNKMSNKKNNKKKQQEEEEEEVIEDDGDNFEDVDDDDDDAGDAEESDDDGEETVDIENKDKSKEDLYAIIGLQKGASANDIRLAYKKLAIQYHPDRNKDAEATEKFQQISRAYAILSDEKKRKQYDQYGTVEDEITLFADKDPSQSWEEYWRRFYKKVTADDVERVMQEYRFSEEEKGDVLKYYKQFKGDMYKLLCEVMCSNFDDEKRFREIIDAAINAKTVERFSSYDSAQIAAKIAKERKQEAKDRKEAEKELAKAKTKEKKAATAVVAKRPKEKFDSVTAALAAKYGVPNQDDCQDIPDDEFERIQAAMMRNKSGGSSKTAAPSTAKKRKVK